MVTIKEAHRQRTSPPPPTATSASDAPGAAQESLARQQSALARLFVDSDLRIRAERDPASVAAELGISPDEMQAIAHPAADGIARFAQSLRHKRLSAARRILPLTAQHMGARFATEFGRYAAAAVLRDGHDYLGDASAFAAGLAARRDTSAPLRALLRYEVAMAQMRLGVKKWQVLPLAFHPRALIAWSQSSDAALPPRRSPTLVFWLRYRGGRAREWRFGRAPHRS